VVWIATANPKLSSYKRIEAALTEAGLTVWPIAYSDVEPEQSIVYQVNNKPATSEYLKSMLKTREVTVPPPNIKIDATRSDIILILGSNLPERFTKPLPAPLTPQAETQQNPNPRTDTPSLPSTNQPAPNLTTP
jgi:hypothetical protein